MISREWLNTLVWPTLAVGLLGCDRAGSPESMLDDYADRVENVTEVAAELPPPFPLESYPSHRARRMEFEELRIGVLDALKLVDCNLLPLIVERNAILGRVMPASQRLIYEIRFLQGLRACAGLLDRGGTGDPELHEFMSVTLAAKERGLRKVLWAATFDSTEMESVFSLANAPLPTVGDGGFVNSHQAILALVRLAESLRALESVPDSKALEAHLQSLYLHEYGGRLAKTLDLLRRYLERAAGTLELAVAERPFCHSGVPNRKSKILKTVFIKFYGGAVQPFLARVHQQARQWHRALRALLAEQPQPLPQAFQSYWQKMWSQSHESGLWQHFERAVRRHTEAWQALLGGCGLMPGAARRTDSLSDPVALAHQGNSG